MTDATTPPELTARIDEIVATVEWMAALQPHSPPDQKTLLMELRRDGFISHAVTVALFAILDLSGA